MKTFIAVCLIAPCLLIGGEKVQQTRKTASEARPAGSARAAKTAQKQPALPEGGLPAGAVQVDANTWHWKAPDGKTWMYRKTPFGLSRGVIEDKPPAQDDIPPGFTVKEDGDVLKFERPSPFGPLKWTRSKSELTELEQRVWEREQAKTAAAAEASKAADSDKEEEKEKEKDK